MNDNIRIFSEPRPNPEDDFDRNYDRAVYEIFNRFALEDQRSYYQRKIKDNRDAARAVNFWRAMFSFAAGVASAAMALLVQSSGIDCAAANVDDASACLGLGVLAIVSVVAPAIGAAFTTLGDLYQWDRTSAIYEVAVENLVVADAESPDEEMDDTRYRQSLTAFSSGTLQVMKDETAQWGTLIRTPQQLEDFINSAADQSDFVQRRRIEREDEARAAFRANNPDAPPPLNVPRDSAPRPTDPSPSDGSPPTDPTPG